jgi:hypothetical protein
MGVERQYHSCVLLLPDARVVALGGYVDNGDHIRDDVEVYSPSYLFRGPRPVITSAPGVVQHGSTFVIGTPKASEIDSVVLMRPGSTTHHTDTEQRAVPLSFVKKSSSQLLVTAPQSAFPHYSDISGYYMLFVLNDLGVPSVAKFVYLD